MRSESVERALNRSAAAENDTPPRYDAASSEQARPLPANPPGRLWQEHEQTLDLDLRRLSRALWYRKSLFSFIFMSIMLAALLVVLSLVPKYTATATVLIAPNSTSVVDIPSIKAPLSTASEAIASEVEVIKSRPLVEQVIAEARFRDYVSAPPPRTPVGLLLGAVLPPEKIAATRDWLSAMAPARLASGNQTGVDRDDAVLDYAADDRELHEAFYRGLSVQQVGESRVIRISFEATDPVFAAAVSNALAQAYVDSQLDAKLQARGQAAELLRNRLEDLRERVRAANAAVEKFRTESGLIKSAGIELAKEELAGHTTRLFEEHARLISLQAQLRKIEALQQGGAVESLYDLLDSLGVSRLQEQETNLRNRIARESQELGPRHPLIQDLNAELRAVMSKLRTEVGLAVLGLRSEAAITADRAEELERSIAELRERIAGLNAKQHALQQLEAEAEVNRSLYETFLTRMRETEQATFDEADARVLAFADPPSDPSSPKRKLLLALALVGAFCVSSGVVFGLEFLNEGFSAEEELTRAVGVPILAVVPRFSASWFGESGRFDRLTARCGSAYTEAVCDLYASLDGAAWGGRGASVITVTSSSPGEGKSTIVALLSRVAVQFGRRVLVIDCDLRRGRQHACFGLEGRTGLSDYLWGAATGEDLLPPMEATSGVHVITAGSEEVNPQRVLRSPLLGRLLNAAREAYDLILIDTPPVLAVADPVFLASVSDATVVVVKWRRTPRWSVLRAVSRLASSGATVVGCVLNQVDQSVHKGNTYGYLKY